LQSFILMVNPLPRLRKNKVGISAGDNMIKLLAVTAATILLAVSAAAQTAMPPAGAPATPPQAQKSEFELLSDAAVKARRISDPIKRIEAYEKLLTDFPKSSPQYYVNKGILDTHIEFWPQRTEKILELIRKVIDPVRENRKTSHSNNTHNQIATQLIEAGILIDEAERLASKGLALFDEQEFVKQQKRFFAGLEETVPDDEELARRFRAERAKNLTTLGRVHLKKGKVTEAEALLKEAYAANPTIVEANLALAELAIKAGNDAAALEYLTSAAVSGRLKPDLRRQLETVYRRTNKGSLDGLEQWLDARHKILMPNPVKAERYRPTPSRTNRVVLAEVFTGSGCVPCVAIDLSFEAALERYGREDLAVLMYHLHSPAPDPMTNPSTQARGDFYGVTGTPKTVIDGSADTEGGGPRDVTPSVFKRTATEVEKRLEEKAEAEIKLEAALVGNAVRVKVAVDNLAGKFQTLKLQIALVEDELHYGGENRLRLHPMVVRSLAGPLGGGFTLKPSRPATVQYTFDLPKISAALKAYLDAYEVSGKHGHISFSEKKYRMDDKNLSVVAFVQDEKSRRVLQSAYLKVRPAAAAGDK
jgi:tetratricopeptide (TPR) repeat protein